MGLKCNAFLDAQCLNVSLVANNYIYPGIFSDKYFQIIVSVHVSTIIVDTCAEAVIWKNCPVWRSFDGNNNTKIVIIIKSTLEMPV